MSSIELQRVDVGGDLSKQWPREEDEVVFPSINYDIYRYRFPDDLRHFSWEEASAVFVNAGILAPSSHNMQARFYELDRDNRKVRIIPDGGFIGGPSDETGREAVIGVGTCAENMIEAMWAYGLEPKANIISSLVGGRKLVGVEIDLGGINEGCLTNQNIINLMQIRRVYRGPFNRQELVSNTIWQKLVQIASIEGISTVVRTDRYTKTALALVQYAADNVVLQNSGFREELGNFMAPNNTQEQRVMPGSTFGLNDKDAEQLSKQLAKGGLLRGAFASGFPQSDKDAILSAHGLVIMSVKEDSPEYWVKAGMAMQRVWLYAQANGLGVGVMAGMVEVAAKAQDLLRILGTKGVPAVVMRMGIPLNSSWPRSPRVGMENVTVSR
jgi:nitroreductase